MPHINIPTVPTFDDPKADRRDKATFPERAQGQYNYLADLAVPLNVTVTAINDVVDELSEAYVLNPNHIFADDTARDSFFSTQGNRDGLYQRKTLISVGAGWDLWVGVDQPTSYNNANWEEKNAVVQGANGTNGIDAPVIVSAAFNGNDIDFTLDDASVVTVTDGRKDITAPNPNLLINGDFSVWQRGSSFTSLSSGSYSVDRWIAFHASTVNIDKSSATTAGYIQTPVCRVSKQAGAAQLVQRIEVGQVNAQLTKGGTYTLSTELRQVITGITGNVVQGFLMRYRMINGTVSDEVQVDFSDKTLAVSVLATKTATLTIPACSDTSQIADALELVLIFESAPIVTVDFNWMKLELGSVATPFVADDPSANVAKCQRYYTRLLSGPIDYFYASGTWDTGNHRLTITLPTIMRQNPISTVTSWNGSVPSAQETSTSSFGCYSPTKFRLSTNGFIEFDAEL